MHGFISVTIHSYMAAYRIEQLLVLFVFSGVQHVVTAMTIEITAICYSN